MRVFLAWHNLAHDKKRTLAATAGVFASALLIFIQLFLLETVKNTVSNVHSMLDFDLILLPSSYDYMNSAGRFERAQVQKAAVCPGVKSVMPMGYATGRWLNPETKARFPVMLLGVRADPDFFPPAVVKAGLASIDQANTALVDRHSNPSLGSIAPGSRASVNRVDLHVAGNFDLGAGFYGDGALLVSNSTFHALARTDRVSYGLIQLADGADPDEVKKKIASQLPDHMVVLERSDFLDVETGYFVSTIPIGVFVRMGVLVSYLVGAVILFQILWTSVSNNLDEFSTLKAAGFTDRYVEGVVLQEAALLAFLGYPPALLAAAGIGAVVREVTRLPARLSVTVALEVLVLTLAMCLSASLLALRKLKTSDPADLF